MRSLVLLSVLLGACAASAPVPECPEPVAHSNVNRTAPAPEEPEVSTMSPERLDTIIREETTEVRSDGRIWEMAFQGVALAVVIDTSHDRMRVLSPIGAEADMTDEERRLVMAANFHTALDARYATSRGMLYSAFIHPLGSLTERDLRSAIRQVATLASTYGTHYSSGELMFGAP